MDADHARFQCLCDAPDTFVVRCEEIGGESVDRVIRLPDHIIRVVEANDGRQQSERLLACYRHIRVMLVNTAGSKGASVTAVSAAADQAAFLNSVRDVMLDAHVVFWTGEATIPFQIAAVRGQSTPMGLAA